MAEVASPLIPPPEPLNERRGSLSSGVSPHGERVDSGVQVSPVSTNAPAGTHAYTSFESHYFVLPPLITGHGRLVRARQTVPTWSGVLIVAGGFIWVVGCAMYV